MISRTWDRWNLPRPKVSEGWQTALIGLGGSVYIWTNRQRGDGVWEILYLSAPLLALLVAALPYCIRNPMVSILRARQVMEVLAVILILGAAAPNPIRGACAVAAGTLFVWSVYPGTALWNSKTAMIPGPKMKSGEFFSADAQQLQPAHIVPAVFFAILLIALCSGFFRLLDPAPPAWEQFWITSVLGLAAFRILKRCFGPPD